MKTKILFLALAFVTCFGAFAQKKELSSEKKKEFKEFKVKFIAQEMDLTDSQKSKFAELYSAMMDDRSKIMGDAYQAKKKVESMKSASENDYKEATEALAQARARDAQLEKKYDEKFAQFLSQKQIYKMKEAENKFRETLSQMRKGKKHKKTKK